MSGPVQMNESQRIRGPRLEVFRKQVTFDEAVRIADAENRVLPSNKRIDQEIMGDGPSKKHLRDCLTGTLIAYAPPGKPLGKKIVYIDSSTHHRWIFPVPEDLQEKTDCVLVTEHPHYRIEIDRNDLFIHASYLTLLEGFPLEDGGYRADPHHCIPLGEKVGPDDPDIRYLSGRWRVSSIVPVRRMSAPGNHNHIWLFELSNRSDMIVEAPAEETKEAEPAPVKEEAKKDSPLLTFSDIMTYRTNLLRDMIATGMIIHSAYLKSSVTALIDTLMRFFPPRGRSDPERLKSFVDASKILGEFVTKELAGEPQFKDIVPELKAYYIQKLQELKEVQK